MPPHGGETQLTLAFNVPSRYFYSQTIDSVNYESGVAVTFHDRSSGDDGACYTNRASASAVCSQGESASWTVTETVCDSVLTGALDFNALFREGQADHDLIIVEEDPEGAEAYDPDSSWEIYMIAQVETFAAYTVQSDMAGQGDIDFNNNANLDQSDQFDADHLSITRELPSFQYLPFRISIPKMIEIEDPSTELADPCMYNRKVFDRYQWGVFTAWWEKEAKGNLQKTLRWDYGWNSIVRSWPIQRENYLRHAFAKPS